MVYKVFKKIPWVKNILKNKTKAHLGKNSINRWKLVNPLKSQTSVRYFTSQIEIVLFSEPLKTETNYDLSNKTWAIIKNTKNINVLYKWQDDVFEDGDCKNEKNLIKIEGGKTLVANPQINY